MPIRYALLKRLLMVLFDLSPSQAQALGSRFKHLQSNALLPEQRVGPAWAKYSLEDTLRIVFTFELIDIGLSPVRALRVVDTHWTALQIALASIWQARTQQEGAPQLVASVWEIVPHALTEIGPDTALRDVPIADQAVVVTEEALHVSARARHGIYVHLDRLLVAFLDACGVAAPHLIATVHEELDRLAAVVQAKRPGRSIRSA